MVYGIYINSLIFYPVEHMIAMMMEIDCVVSVLLQLGMGAKF